MGVHISPVQEYAVELMLIGEVRLKAQDFSERFKFAVISHDPGRWVSKMFPKWFPEVADDDDSTDILDTSKGPVTYVFEDDAELTPEQARAEFQRLVAQSGGRLSASEMDPDEGWI